MRWTTIGAAASLLVVLGTSDARAQTLGQAWIDNGYATLSLGFQTKSQTFTELSAPEIYGESALITVPHRVGGGSLIDVSGGVRVWRNLAVGLGISHFSDSETATLAAEVPNPLFASSPRQATASTGKLSHGETALHLQFMWMVPLDEKIQVAAVLGPSFYRIKQDFVTNLAVTEGGAPFTTVSISSVETEKVSKRATGFTIGVDGTYLLTPQWGAGAFVRFSSASADLSTPGGTVSVDAGGFQFGFGLRSRF
jgi:hypothetical protein